MKISRTLLPVLLLATLFTFPVVADEIDQIFEAADAIEEKVIEWRRDIHEHPELGNREFRTAALVAEHLESLGLEVETGIAHTGVVAILEGNETGPTIALRADMDALPVKEQTGLPFASTVTAEYNGQTVPVMHACGHDNHTAILMGVAEILAGMREELPGSVMFIFQPAEEGAPRGEEGGAALMLEEGIFRGERRPDAAFALHVGPMPPGIYYKAEGVMAAADELRITITGRQTHGSAPWLGIDPITASAQIINALQAIPSRQMELTKAPVVVSIGSIHGGIRGNIIPDEVEMVGTIRTLDTEMREDFLKRISRTIDMVAESFGAEASVEINPYAPVVWNDPALVERMLPTLERAADGRVRNMPAIMGAEDFAFFAQEVPSFYFWLGVNEPGVAPYEAPVNHSPMFDANEDALVIGVRALAAAAWDYLSSN